MAFFSRAVLVLAFVFCLARPAAADGVMQQTHLPRGRSCCAFARRIPIHLGATHVPILISLTGSKEGLGQHSYTGYDQLGEYLSIIYTTRGGFLDLGHLRDYADMTSYLAVQLRPLLAAGHGEVELAHLESRRRVRVLKAVPPELLHSVAIAIARRAAFEISTWMEVVQFYGSGKTPGATEVYSAFTPDDLYSNLLGTYLGARAVQSELPYDVAMTRELREIFDDLGAVSHQETNRLFDTLEGKWWSAAAAWPSADIAMARWFEIGPEVHPLLAPATIAPSPPPGVDSEPAILKVPTTDERGGALTDYYQTEFLPEERDFARFAYEGGGGWVTGADLPRIVAGIHRTSDEMAATRAALAPVTDEYVEKTALTHYLNGLRLVDLDMRGGLLVRPHDTDPHGVLGGSLTAVAGDTRSGDFDFARFALGGSVERGLIAGFSLFRTNAVWFCHDPETNGVRPPLVSLLGPCKGGEMLGLGGNVFEGLHDGRTGRTALRPIAMYGVFNPLRNGQSESYQRVRLLLRGGGDVEHFWTEQEHATTIGRVGGGAVLLARSAGGRVEARGSTQYLIDPAATSDAVLQTNVGIRFNFLTGAKPAKGSAESIDPWGVSSIGILGGYAYASRPLHSFPDPEAPFVSAEHDSTWQVLVTASLGFEGLSF